MSGGTLTFAVNAETTGLDPTIPPGGGAGGGGTELAALYDTLMRWNPTTRHYLPGTAESVTPNHDFTSWTLKLHPGIKFGDGTDYNADAVKNSFMRHMAPTSHSTSKSMLTIINTTTVVDPLTLRFDLKSGWAGFPYVLTREPGMVPSPTAIQKLGADFNLNPVGAGAGPFQIVSFKPGEAVQMKRNPNYWGGPVYLDGLNFVFIAGFPPRYLALQANTVQAAYLRDPATIAQAKSGGFPGIQDVVQGAGWNINTSKPPGNNPLVRQAIVAAIDPNVINQRIRSGKGLPGDALFQSSFPWDPGVPGVGYDLNRAKMLVQQAKAAGWDGKIELKCHNGLPDLTLVTQAMLENAGMQVSIRDDQPISAFIADALLAHNYQVACSGVSVPADDGAYVQLSSQLRSDSPTNSMGYASPRMDAALNRLQAAATDADKKAAFKDIADIFNGDLPVDVFEATPEDIAYSPKVHGIAPNTNGVVFFDKAWIQH